MSLSDRLKLAAPTAGTSLSALKSTGYASSSKKTSTSGGSIPSNLPKTGVKLSWELKKYAQELPEITTEERLVPYIVGEPMYRAIYAPHGRKLEQYGKAGSKAFGPQILGALLGTIVGMQLGKRVPTAGQVSPTAVGGLLGMLAGSRAGGAYAAQGAPENLRKALKQEK